MASSAIDAPAERITYLIANHNHGGLVGECLDSLRRQTSDHWLAVVCDDASTDGSLQAIEPYLDGKRVRLIVNPHNVGYILTLQVLLSASETDIVGILDPDDALAPNATERVLSAYADDLDRAFVYSRFAVFDRVPSRPVGSGGYAVPLGKTALQIGGIGALRTFRLSAYRETPGLDAGLDYAEDRDLVYKLEEATPPVFIDEVLYYYRRLPTSQSQDPAKMEIGARNHLRARCAALRRRRIHGVRGLFWRLVFACEYVQSSQRYPVIAKQLGVALRKMLGRLEELAGSPTAR